MNTLEKPLIVRFDMDHDKDVAIDDDVLKLGVFSHKDETLACLKAQLEPDGGAKMSNQAYDYLAVDYRPVHKLINNNPAIMKACMMRTAWLIDLCNELDKPLPVLSRLRGTKQFYLLNQKYDQNRKQFVMPNTDQVAQAYVAPQNVVQETYNRFKNQAAWEKHQSKILKKFKALMPLTDKHRKELHDPKRGLEDKDLQDFFDWESNVVVVPDLLDDNLVGIPSIKASCFNDVQLKYQGQEVAEGQILALKTGGKAGFMIPMKNINGDIPKYQIATDISKINCLLKARAKDGVSIQKSEYYDKKSGEYKFKTTDGRDSGLHMIGVNASYQQGRFELRPCFADCKGRFSASLKTDIKEVLRDRGYQLPAIIDSLQAVKESKYIWMARGDMIGPKTSEFENISPSNPGFIVSRKAKDNSNHYVAIITEGALKGVIAAKYLNCPDQNGHSLADRLADKRGIIVVQVPGVAESFVRGAAPLYQRDDIQIDQSYIAMDADGRKNRNVALGIQAAYDEIGRQNGSTKVNVLTWDPAQKGLDDALLAVAQHQINLDEMGIKIGSPQELFPLSQTESQIPYKLNGKRAWTKDETPEWQKEWEDEKAKTLKKHQAIEEKQVSKKFNLQGLGQDNQQEPSF